METDSEKERKTFKFNAKIISSRWRGETSKMCLAPDVWLSNSVGKGARLVSGRPGSEYFSVSFSTIAKFSDHRFT